MSEPSEDVGGIGEEMLKLIAAAQDWAHRIPVATGATGAPECQWCPVCQLMAVLRGDRPEVAEKATETARTVLAALVTAFTENVPKTEPPDRPAPASAHPSGRRVQRINLLGEDGE